MAPSDTQQAPATTPTTETNTHAIIVGVPAYYLYPGNFYPQYQDTDRRLLTLLDNALRSDGNALLSAPRPKNLFECLLVG